jgi:hypothetical protein
MIRRCPSCGAELAPDAVRCSCGSELPESFGLRSSPDDPRCCVCGRPLEPTALRCPACGADGYPALRPRRGHKSQGPPK